MTVVLSARGLAVGYPQAGGWRPVLEDFALDVAPTEVVSLLGPSGVGKSSVLRALAGLQPAAQGEVRLLGEPLLRPHPQVAVAFQDPCLLPWLTLRDNVAFGLDFRRQPRLPAQQARQRVQDAIAAVGLAAAQERYPAELSGGMAQRTALARCLARQPKVLLLDEPFGALDEVTRGDMQQLLLQLVARQGSAVVLITHDIDEALLVSDRVLLLGDHPARIIGEWRIELAQPRTDAIEALGALRIEILRTLRRASRPNPPLPAAESAHVPARSPSLAP
ncbi:ABC transporter ATP-binding protein [Pseudomonas sp. EpS/L25]|uniref:ABC transporter ATP-binding protein n=1 Tax=Pseudomonas sp. EpS/L25 TaxID=1749078 RepID=UPI0007433D92|nr:ABC transporter ATP-binding protein [Pseudomonas sp. EpS/L25]KUM42966.1 ABC transporter ATP-binding protein [Pseudomonas sp. EpS/L25]